MQQENPLNPVNFNDESINLREEIEKYVYHWKWFLVGLAVALVTVFMYLRYTPNQYEVATTILINDKDSGGLTSELSAFQDLGLLGGSQTSLDNEIELLKSRSLLERVIKELGINVEFYKQGRVIKSPIFINNSPLSLKFFAKDSSFYSIDTSFIIQVKSATNFSLLSSNGEESEYVFGENIATKFGAITITPNRMDTNIAGEELFVIIKPLKSVLNYYTSKIQIQPVNKNASVIKLSLTDQVKLKAQAILDNLVLQYNYDAVKDKSLMAKNTETFINKRLEIISEDLSNVDKGVEQFKTKNNLSDMVTEASLVLESNAELEKKIVDFSTQLKLVEYIQVYVNSNTDDLIPANLGLADVSTNQNTTNYNELLLERNRLLNSSSKLNPVIVNLEAQLLKIKKSISQSLANLKASLNISLRGIQQQENRLNSKISAAPKQEREFRDIQRQQQIIEGLYLYLLQKREENAITLAATQPNAKVIDSAFGNDTPVAPKRKIVYLAGILIGLLVPFSVLYLLFLLDNKVHSRKDIEGVVKAPYLGDIPKSVLDTKVVVSGNDRNSVAESFRLLRTNINFMLSKEKEHGKLIFLSSTIAGEGKTFISINLAAALALSNKKVLLLGADIRNPKIHEYLNIVPEKGLTHFLMDTNITFNEIINSVKEGFDIVQSGVIPPNPSELLMNGRFEEALAYGKEHYDYVIVDTAPVNLVTDTLLLGQQADLFIYIIRANFLDKRLLEVPKLFYSEKRLPNMAVLLNDVNFERGDGYGYGYGYSYGYGYGERGTKKPWWKRK